MRHPEELLSAYADGELPEDKRREVEEHLKIYKHCRRELEKLKNWRALSVMQNASEILVYKV